MLEGSDARAQQENDLRRRDTILTNHTCMVLTLLVPQNLDKIPAVEEPYVSLNIVKRQERSGA